MKISLPSIHSNYEGFSHLINLAAATNACWFDDIEIDMSHVTWFDANMCAPFGAILYKMGCDINTVTLTNSPTSVETILSKNGFLCNYGRPRRLDTHGSTIEYKRFEPKDDRYFANYIETQMVGKGIPEMSSGLVKKFRESIYEIFSNAVIHSQTKLGIFSCGQYFPKKHRMDFSVADLGIGIRQNLHGRLGLDLPAEQAINWALEGKNTTKSGPIPGGLGLKLLREFIELNQGRIQVVSDKGYWELYRGEVVTKSFSDPFPGTVVNIEINTADTKSYCLSSEISPDDIF
ncbi:MAG: hypothetical protein U1D97_10075 [Desulfuromonadales bacterium]|nr:hypothetical protein [Desulfuromonadales bacterium]